MIKSDATETENHPDGPGAQPVNERRLGTDPNAAKLGDLDADPSPRNRLNPLPRLVPCQPGRNRQL
jgi:hypothetical protein